MNYLIFEARVWNHVREMIYQFFDNKNSLLLEVIEDDSNLLWIHWIDWDAQVRIDWDAQVRKPCDYKLEENVATVFTVDRVLNFTSFPSHFHYFLSLVTFFFCVFRFHQSYLSLNNINLLYYIKVFNYKILYPKYLTTKKKKKYIFLIYL